MGHLRAVGAGAGLGRDAVRREVRREELRGPVVDGAVVHVGPGREGTGISEPLCRIPVYRYVILA